MLMGWKLATIFGDLFFGMRATKVRFNSEGNILVFKAYNTALITLGPTIFQ